MFRIISVYMNYLISKHDLKVTMSQYIFNIAYPKAKFMSKSANLEKESVIKATVFPFVRKWRIQVITDSGIFLMYFPVSFFNDGKNWPISSINKLS